MTARVIKEYETHLDAKNRLTIRDAKSEYFAVKTFSDGRVLLEPRVLVPPQAVSRRTLQMRDKSAKNFKRGRVSAPIDLDRHR